MLIHATVIEGTGRRPFPGTIRVVGARIVDLHAAEPVPDSEWPSDEAQLDCRGLYAVPGLVDAHNHLCRGCEEEDGDGSPALDVMLAAARAARDVSCGVTTMRSLGEVAGVDRALRDASARGLMGVPRLQHAHEPLTPTRGHRSTEARQVDGGPAIRDAVRRNVAAGAQWIKVMASGGDRTPGSRPTDPGFSLMELRAAVEEAHARGARVAAHCHGGPGLERAIAAGVDSIEHGSCLADRPDLLGRMAERGTWLVATPAPAARQRPERHTRLPAADDRIRELRSKAATSVAMAVRAGVRVALGQDGLHGEMARQAGWLVRAGLTPTQALAAATRSGAELCGLEREVGTLERGRVADLVVLGSDPLVDLEAALRDVRLVVQRGEVVWAAGDEGGRTSEAARMPSPVRGASVALGLGA